VFLPRANAPGARGVTGDASSVAAMVAPMATPPSLSPEQRTAALAKAAEARTARAELKNRLKLGTLSLREALDSSDSTVGKLKVVSLLESLPGVGKVKARKIMDDIGIAENRRVQGLGQQQKATLLDQLGK
jgi:DNA uptake protein ComE-like DNA-binding protein